MPLVSGSHLYGDCLARGAQENWTGVGDDFTHMFLYAALCWSDGGYTIKRPSTEAVGSIPDIFYVYVHLVPGRRRCHHAAPISSRLSGGGASVQFIDRVR